MKKLFLFAMTMVLSMAVFAKSDLKVKSGSMAWAKEKVQVVVKFDFSYAKWDKDTDFKTWCAEDYEARLNNSVNGFIKGFNNKSKGAQATTNEDGAKYRVVVKIANMDWRPDFFGIPGQLFALCWGVIEVSDIASGEVVCTIEIDGANGDSDFVPNDRFTKCYELVGETLAKTKK